MVILSNFLILKHKAPETLSDLCLCTVGRESLPAQNLSCIPKEGRVSEGPGVWSAEPFTAEARWGPGKDNGTRQASTPVFKSGVFGELS